jgi:ATP-dependent helicase/nuclease subunit A
MGCIAPCKKGAITVNEASRAQLNAARPETSTWLSANAGSGKTRVLTDRVARLLLDDVAPEHILCLTYTKAAAAEMQNRLFKRLGEWSMLNNVELVQALEDITDQKMHLETDLAHARTLFARAIEAPGGLKIQTIHSFCSSLLRRFPLEAGVAPDFKEIDELARDEIAKLVLDKMCETPTDRVLFSGMSQLVGEASFNTLLSEIIASKSHFNSAANSKQIADFLNAPEGISAEQLFHQSFAEADLEFIKKLIPILLDGGASAAKLAEKLMYFNKLSVEYFQY